MKLEIEGSPPPKDMLFANCDFNACGLSGEPGDDCYYRINADALAMLPASIGAMLFIYTDDIAENGLPEIFGYIATLEHYSFGHASGWRARPDKDTWYRGPMP